MENTLRNLQLVELEILKDVAKFCDDNDITYYLDSGTLLGAIRHGGFIPWDDDIDICIDWANYKKFVKLASKCLPEQYFVQNYKTDSKACIRWTKIRKNGTTSMDRALSKYDIHDGVCIDVFALSGIADNKLRRGIQDCANIIMNVLLTKHLAIAKNMELSRFERMITSVIPESIRCKVISFLEAFAFIDIKKTKYCSITFYATTKKAKKFPREIYYPENKILVDFEDCKFYVPSKWEEYLEIKYKNWRQPPPEEKRGGHGNIIIDLNNDYSCYKELD